MLVVCTPTGLERQGVRNEIEIAADLEKTLNDSKFIIPLRLKKYDQVFRIAHRQYIDFSSSWSAGLAELVDLLRSTLKVPRDTPHPTGEWLETQRKGSTRVIAHAERLTSNWLVFRRLPGWIRYCEPPTGFSVEQFQSRSLHQWPAVPFGGGVLTFASPDSAGLLGDNLPAKLICSTKVSQFLKEGWSALSIPWFDARRQFSDLCNQSFDKYLADRGLHAYKSSNRYPSWWANIRTAPLSMVPFNWPEQRGRRQIIGQSGKRGVHWHYAVSIQVRTSPFGHARISARLIFSENGLDPIADTKRMHRLRRTFSKSWRNARWRDMLSAFLWWLSQGQSEMELRVSHQQRIVLSLPTASFMSPVSIMHTGDEPPDEDDPDVDDWDDFEETFGNEDVSEGDEQ